MIVSIQEAHYIADYRIWLRFNTGETGEVDLKDIVFQYVATKPIQDIDQFKQFYLDTWPTLAWKCGFDVSPETLYEQATGKQIPWLQFA